MVTGTPLEVGAAVDTGQVLVEVSGRPVFALLGAFPAYRDFSPGAEGRDVAQLRQALGVDAPGGNKRSAVFDGSTQKAVNRLYEKSGYPAPSSGLPASDVEFLPSFPLTVTSVDAPVGTKTPKSILSVSGGPLQVEMAADATTAGLFTPGRAVGLQMGTQTFTGTVDRLTSAEPSAEQGDTQSTNQVLISLRSTPTNAAPGAMVSVNVERGRSEAGLVVPSSAVWTATDGVTHLRVVSSSGEIDVPVKVTFSALGRCAVVAAGEGPQLSVGERVIVSSDNVDSLSVASLGSS